MTTPDSASGVQYKPCEICTTQSWCETHGCQCYPISAPRAGHCNHFPGQVNCEWCTVAMCCVDYPRCDCNSPPEPDNAPTLQPCGHPWKSQHDFKCILCSSPGPAHEECLGCSSPTTCEKYGCSVKRQRAIDSASGGRDATSAQSAEEQRFLHGAAAVTGLTQQDYDALVRDAMLWRTRSPTGAGGNVKAFVCCEGVGQHAPGCIAQEAAP